MALASEEEADMIEGLYFRGETPEQVGKGLGVDRTTVGRRMKRFNESVRANKSISYHAA